MITPVYLEIPGMPGYRVGDDGSFWTKWLRGNRYLPRRLGMYWKYMVGGLNEGYLKVHIRINDVDKLIGIHQLVMLTFVGPCPEGLEVCHNDGNTQNNALSNLRYDTHFNNMQQRKEHGTLPVGEQSGINKLTWERVASIRKSTLPQFRLAEIHNVSPQTISDIKCNKKWVI